MSQLVIGHVWTEGARVWVRGGKKSGAARLRYRAEGTAAWTVERCALEPHLDHVGIFELRDLTPATPYECELSFEKGPAPPVGKGRFVTAPAEPREVRFLLGSCNWTRSPFNIKDPDPAWRRLGELAASMPADFMIHCGDQIYADLPAMPLEPDVGHYRSQYRAAWKRRPTAELLARLPHYMILDDHEIFDGFANDVTFVGRPIQPVRDVALAAYREYQHAHNPQTFPSPALYYTFGFAGVEFFVMDVRSERYRHQESQMISVLQMHAFQDWLLAHASSVKFVVSSVPFVGETRDEADKWCGAPFLHQREEIVDFVAANGITRLAFLTGDMHCSYHATLRVETPGGGRFQIHELMSSPINQFGTGLHVLVDRPERATPAGCRYRCAIPEVEFYGAHSNVMAVRVGVDGRVAYEIHRTKSGELPVLAGSFDL